MGWQRCFGLLIVLIFQSAAKYLFMDLLGKHQYQLWCKQHWYLGRHIQYMWKRAGRIKLEWKSKWDFWVGTWTLHLCRVRAGKSASVQLTSHMLHNKGDSHILVYDLGIDICGYLAFISSIWVPKCPDNLQLKCLIKEDLYSSMF